MQGASDTRSRSRLQPRLQPMHLGRPPPPTGTVPARCRLSRSPPAQREAQMLVRLSIIGAFAAILMLPTTLSAQINPGGAINPGGGINPGGAFNPGGGINPGGAINPGAINPGGDI